jgi:hypothetical protein
MQMQFPRNTTLASTNSLMTSEQLSWLKKGTAALVVAVLAFGKQIGHCLIEENRYYYLWKRTDSLALIFDILVLASIAFGLSLVLRKLKLDKLRWIFNHVFLLAIAGGLISLLPQRIMPPSRWAFVVWGLVLSVGIIGLCLRRTRHRLVEYGINLCLILSPLVIILFYQTLTMGSWSRAEEHNLRYKPAMPARVAENQKQNPVFIFVFDEWDYKFATESGGYPTALPNLHRLSEQSYDFRQTWTFSSHTYHSLPALLYQTD